MATDTASGVKLKKVVVLGANGAMGAGSAAMFAGGGCEVTLVARDLGKVERALAQIQGIAKSERIADTITPMTYADGMEQVLADADLIFECVAEDMSLKRDILRQIDAARPKDSLVATVSSGLSIREMTADVSESLQSHFAGIHLYNPPHVMTGVEVIPHPSMDPALVAQISTLLNDTFGRQVITCADMPAFAGNRIGFKVLNEVAQLAEQHGVQKMDLLIGPYTGRAMAPLATIDLVGWDVHQAVVENVRANVTDEAISAFEMPAYMKKLTHKGHLGDKTPMLGGFYRRVTDENGKAWTEAVNPTTGGYAPVDKAMSFPWIEEIRDLHRRGKYEEGVRRFMQAEGPDADLARKVILGYISYALNRVGPNEVVASYDDVDRIMTAGFNWAPPSGMVDLIGVQETIAGMERAGLPVPSLLTAAAKGEVKTPLFNLPFITPGRYFAG